MREHREYFQIDHPPPTGGQTEDNGTVQCVFGTHTRKISPGRDSTSIPAAGSHQRICDHGVEDAHRTSSLSLSLSQTYSLEPGLLSGSLVWHLGEVEERESVRTLGSYTRSAVQSISLYTILGYTLTKLPTSSTLGGGRRAQGCFAKCSMKCVMILFI